MQSIFRSVLRRAHTLAACACTALTFASQTFAAEPSLPLVFSDNFDKGSDRWEPSEKKTWKIKALTDGADKARGNVFSQFEKKATFKPPHRSPFHFALVKDVVVGDFTIDVKAKSTVADYGHRDMCLFFGYQDPAHLYYVHLGKETDDHANQIFIVDDKPRTKISDRTTKGTPWDDKWHHIRVVRRVADGTIEVYYDDLETPVMMAKNTRFTWGRVGIGSFDDTGDWDDFELRGTKVEKPSGGKK